MRAKSRNSLVILLFLLGVRSGTLCAQFACNDLDLMAKVPKLQKRGTKGDAKAAFAAGMLLINSSPPEAASWLKRGEDTQLLSKAKPKLK